MMNRIMITSIKRQYSDICVLRFNMTQNQCNRWIRNKESKDERHESV